MYVFDEGGLHLCRTIVLSQGSISSISCYNLIWRSWEEVSLAAFSHPIPRADTTPHTPPPPGKIKEYFRIHNISMKPQIIAPPFITKILPFRGPGKLDCNRFAIEQETQR